MKLAVSLVLFFVAMASPWRHAEAQSAADDYTIGIVLDGSWHRADSIAELFVQETTALTEGAYRVRFPASKRLVGDWTAAGAERLLAQLLADPEVDAIIAFGPLAASVASSRAGLAKPVFAPLLVAPERPDLPAGGSGTSGRNNFHYLALPVNLARDLAAFKELGDFRQLTVLFDGALLRGLPFQQERLSEAARAAGLEPTIVAVDSLDMALAALEPGRPVLVGPLVQLSPADKARLYAELQKNKMPSFAWMGRVEVERGLLMSLRPADDFEIIARSLATAIRSALDGTPLAELSTLVRFNENLTLNVAVSKKLGLEPSWLILTDAELLGDIARPDRRSIDLSGAMRVALERNPGVAVSGAAVKQAKARVTGATSGLLPQLDVQSRFRTIDADNAAGGLGGQVGGFNPRNQWTGSATLTQPLVSEPAWAARTAAKHELAGQKARFRAAEIEAALAAGVAYLNVLRAKAVERIEKENLRTTRSNLELARARVRIGSAGRAEVVRFEAQIAKDRQNILLASASRNQAELVLTSVIDWPADQPFATEDASIDDPTLLFSLPGVKEFFAGPSAFRAFRAFLLDDTRSRSPRLAALDADIEASQRTRLSRKREFYIPRLSLDATLNHEFESGGLGAEPDVVPDTGWIVGVNLVFPVFTSGLRSANLGIADAQLRARIEQRRLARLELERDVGGAAHLAGARYAAIRFARDASRSATENLELVRESYVGGAVSIITLLDAQTSARTAQIDATNAVYDFVIAWLTMQAATGQLGVVLDDAERREWLERARRAVNRPSDTRD